MAPPNPAAMMMPPWGPPPAMPMAAPMLNVRVDGLTFEYQLTEDDVRKVFSRYGDVYHVNVDKEGTTAQVQLGQYHQTVAAQHDLDKKQLGYARRLLASGVCYTSALRPHVGSNGS